MSPAGNLTSRLGKANSPRRFFAQACLFPVALPVRDARRRPVLLADAPISRVFLAQCIAGRVRHNELWLMVRRIDDRILTKCSAEIDGFLAIDVVHEPGRFSPSYFGFVFVADTLLDSVAAENQQ